MVAIVLAPLLVAGLAILVLVVLGGGTLSRGGFVPLFRSLAYASGIGFVLWIPFAPLLAIPYGAFVATVAVKETMNAQLARAAAATLIPLGAVAPEILSSSAQKKPQASSSTRRGAELAVGSDLRQLLLRAALSP